MTRVYLNNQPFEQTNVLAMDRGLHYGDGFFTTILGYKNRLLNWRFHQERLLTSQNKLGFPQLDLAKIELELLDKIQFNQEFSRIKLLITRGVGLGYKPPQTGVALHSRSQEEIKPNVWVFITDLPDFAAHLSLPQLKVGFCTTPTHSHPYLSGVKHLNRLENVLAQAELGELDDGIMFYSTGEVAGATQAGLAVIKGNKIVTPASPTIDSTAIKFLGEFAGDLGYCLQESSLTKADLLQADSIILLNAVRGIQAVTQLSGTTYSIDKIEPVWQEFWQRQLK